MHINNKQPTAGQPTLPTRQLWRALLLIFNHYLVEELATLQPRLKGEETSGESGGCHPVAGLLPGQGNSGRMA